MNKKPPFMRNHERWLFLDNIDRYNDYFFYCLISFTGFYQT